MIILRCSFCGTEREAERMCAGPMVLICDGCVCDCAAMLADGPAARWLREVGEAEWASWFSAGPTAEPPGSSGITLVGNRKHK